MATPAFTTIFDHTNPAHRDLQFWRAEGPHGWQTNARHYAALFGEAVVWKADDRVVRFWNDCGTVRQRTYRRVLHSHQ